MKFRGLLNFDLHKINTTLPYPIVCKRCSHLCTRTRHGSVNQVVRADVTNVALEAGPGCSHVDAVVLQVAAVIFVTVGPG